MTRIVLSILVSTFVFSLTALRHFRTGQAPPTLAVVGCFLLGLLSLSGVLAFITHIVRILRVDSMMRAVHDETSRAITTFYPQHGDDEAAKLVDAMPHEPGILVTATSSGFVRMVEVTRLVRAARSAEALVRVEVRPGDHVVEGVPVATVWPSTTGKDVDDLTREVRAVRECIVVAFERTLEQDAGFGFRQLEDIAVKALSPGINDPVTAAHAVGHMGDLLVRLARCRLGPTGHHDDAGVLRAIVLDRDFRYYLDLACSQLRRYASAEPTVLTALMRMLRDVAVSTLDDQQREEIRRQADLVLATASSEMLDSDRSQVVEMHRRVHQALSGAVAEAFADRAGETRSI